MTERIKALCDLTLKGEMFVNPVKTEFDKTDILLTDTEREVKQLCEYIVNQEPLLTEYQTMTGFFRFDGSVVGDLFNRTGHKNNRAILDALYLKPIEGLHVFEWQHATADYKEVLDIGISGIIKKIEESLKKHTEESAREYLFGLKRVAEALIEWCKKCSSRALEFSKTAENEKYRNNLEKLSAALLRAPINAPKTFYEACLTVYVCFSASRDSVGTLDRYLSRFYFNDIKEGRLTKSEAAEYLQELFLMLQASISRTSTNFTRGGESHFCVGGYLPDGTDGYSELSELILDSLVELPTYIPQVTLRWTKKLPREVLYHAMNLERKDKNKRIAFQNDEIRLKAYTEICGMSYKDAVGYTTVGCNEPAFPGGTAGATSKLNMVKALERVLYKRKSEVLSAESFDEIYELFLSELFPDIEKHIEFDNKCNAVRARDLNYISALFFRGCIDKAKSPTRGASDTVICSPYLFGAVNIIDSLIVVKQFVFDEKIITMDELISALESNWEGYEDLHLLIKKRGDFFGNDTERSNGIARQFFDSLYGFLLGKRNLFGYPILMGDLIGYNPHHKWFGEATLATPDGRLNGEMLKFGFGQSGGYDREGLSSLLNSIAKADPHGIRCGATVTNISLDEELIRNDSNFEKTVLLFENYFKMGGVHFQLTYVSRDELIKAKETPDDYKHLRVRVSGFSDYFVKLNEAIQDDIIARTEQK